MTPNQPGPDGQRGIEEVESLDAEDEPLDDASITVVVADDHPMWRDAVARDLADAGFQVVGTAADGAAASTSTCRSSTASRYASSSPPRTCPPRSSSCR